MVYLVVVAREKIPERLYFNEVVEFILSTDKQLVIERFTGKLLAQFRTSCPGLFYQLQQMALFVELRCNVDKCYSK